MTHPYQKIRLSQVHGDHKAAWWVRAPAIVFETGAIAASLYYFGWIRTQATYRTLGINSSALDINATQYIQRGLNPVMTPLIAFGVIIILASLIHRRILLPRQHGTVGRATTLAARIVGYACLISTVSILISPTRSRIGILLPITLMIGTCTLIYADHLTSRPRHATGFGIRFSAFMGLTIIAAGWAITLHSERLGEDYAFNFTSTLSSQPKVILYANERLAISGPGVQAQEILQEDSRYHFRYEGLRILIQEGGHYIFAPEGWSLGRDALLTVPVEGTRVDTLAQPL